MPFRLGKHDRRDQLLDKVEREGAARHHRRQNDLIQKWTEQFLHMTLCERWWLMLEAAPSDFPLCISGTAMGMPADQLGWPAMNTSTSTYNAVGPLCCARSIERGCFLFGIPFITPACSPQHGGLSALLFQRH